MILYSKFYITSEYKLFDRRDKKFLLQFSVVASSECYENTMEKQLILKYF